MRKYVPSYSGTLRSHGLTLPHCISECSGIRIFGKRIKSIAFSTDAAIIKNINADAIIAVYPFTPQASISQAVINVADVPVFVGVGGGYTNGSRSVRLAMQAEHQGAYGVVVNAPMPNEVIAEIKSVVDIPVIATVVRSRRQRERVFMLCKLLQLLLAVVVHDAREQLAGGRRRDGDGVRGRADGL